MTVGEVKHRTEQLLKQNGCEDAEFEARCLLEDIGKVGRGKTLLAHDDRLSPDLADAVAEATNRRIQGEPLQYILGEWDFLSLTLHVGSGVLIPRPETELLCETVANHLKKRTKKATEILDLCAGSGCVGLGIASLVYPQKPHIIAVELSDDALFYLRKNAKRYAQYSTDIVKGNVLADFACFNTPVDVIVSNPPYIKTGDLSRLQREVQYEPRMALDGDADGYRFYRAIADNWLQNLKEDGMVAVEVGIGQAQTVAELFQKVGFIHTDCIRDAFGIERVVAATR